MIESTDGISHVVFNEVLSSESASSASHNTDSNQAFEIPVTQPDALRAGGDIVQAV